MKKIYLNKNNMVTNLIFFLYIYITFVSNYTIYSNVIILAFLGMSAYYIIKNRSFSISFYFVIDMVFIIYSIYQIKSGIAVYPVSSLIKVNTLIKCFFIHMAVHNFMVINKDIKKLLHIYVNAIFCGVITFFIIGWRTLLSGRFLQSTTVNFMGVKAVVHSNSVGIVVAIASIFTIYLFLKQDKIKCFFMAGIFLPCVMLTGSRKSIMIAALGIFLLTMYLYPNKKFGKIILSGAALFIGFILLMKVPFLYSIAGSRIESTIQYLQTGQTEETSMSTRNRLIQDGMSYISQRPKTGYGLDNFRYIASRSGLYSHNNFVELLFSGGYIGFCIYYSKYLILFIGQLRLKMKKNHPDYQLERMLLWIFLLFTIFEYWYVSYYERNFLIVHMFLISLRQIQLNERSTNRMSDRGNI